jgi:Adenylate and Guanylate cyclase catalytic domain
MGPEYMANLSKRFYNDVIQIIKTKYYPYIYIYEIVGDSFVFMINADWIYSVPFIPAIIGLKFSRDLINKTKTYVDIRTGIAYGKILYGKIGNNLRLFGQTMNMASRLENIAEIQNITVSTDFWNKLILELNILKSIDKLDLIDFKIKNMTLKGFSSTDCVYINSQTINNLFI